jgi:hypothetical protein
MSRTRTTSWARDAWYRAAAAREAQLLTTRIGDERMAESARLLSRTHERLDRCAPRVTRGRERRADGYAGPAYETRSNGHTSASQRDTSARSAASLAALLTRTHDVTAASASPVLSG